MIVPPFGFLRKAAGGGASGVYIMTPNTANFNGNDYATLNGQGRILAGGYADTISNILPNDNYWGACTNTAVGVFSGSIYRALYKFDFSMLPAGGTITAVEFGIFENAYNFGTDYDLHVLTQAFVTASHAGTCEETNDSNAVSWNQYSGSSSWATAGGDFLATVYGSFAADENVWQTISSANLLAYAQAVYASPSADCGLLLKATTEAADSRNTFENELGTNGLLPYFKVVFA